MTISVLKRFTSQLVVHYLVDQSTNRPNYFDGQKYPKLVLLCKKNKLLAISNFKSSTYDGVLTARLLFHLLQMLKPDSISYWHAYSVSVPDA